MSRSSAPSIDEIVQQAALLDEDQRLAYLQFTCGNNASLYEQALSRLGSGIDSWHPNSDLQPSPPQATNNGQAGALIDKYRVLRSIGQGGMGEVVLAERADRQYNQQVAIKFVRPGVLSKQVQGRLKVERQILATLDHPNIARLLDGGATVQGTPYIVMEYIDGVPIDTYCNKHRLSIRKRLELFRVVCSAVHNAHQNLIVHRDLKPSNILVMADGTPKLLDFGIAKMLDERQMLHTMAVTQADVRVMTPEHASPEQVRGDVITTASDVYSLGILLYELLTGQRPYVIRSQRLSEIEKAICDDAPLPLSATLSINNDGAKTNINQLCEQRTTTLPKLRNELAGDLANIVAMAIRKEPARRYSSAEQFSTDIGRYLTGMPIAAQRDTWSYRARKFVVRHTLGAVFTALAMITLIAFSVLTTLQARHIEREKMRSERVSSFLVGMFEQADPSRSRGNEITAREMIDTGARRISRELLDEPDTRSTLLSTMGQVYGGLGLYREAIDVLQQSLTTKRTLYGADHPEVAAVMHRLGNIQIQSGDLAAAEKNLTAALTIYRRHFAATSFEVASALASLGELKRNQQHFGEAEMLLRQSLQIFSAAGKGKSIEQLDTLNSLAILLVNSGDYAGAEQTYRSVLSKSTEEFGADHPSVAMTRLNLGIMLIKAGRLSDAEPNIEQALAMYRRILGNAHPNTIDALAIYGDLLRREQAFDKAEQVLQEALALDREIRGPSHESIGFDTVNLALVYHDQGRYSDAQALYKEALNIFRQRLGPTHQLVGWALRSLGITLISMNRHAEAEVQLKQAIDIYEMSLPSNSPKLHLARAALGLAIARQRRFAEAEVLLTTSCTALTKMMDQDGSDLPRVRKWVEELYTLWQKPEEAQRYFASIEALHAKTEKR